MPDKDEFDTLPDSNFREQLSSSSILSIEMDSITFRISASSKISTYPEASIFLFR